MTDPPTTQTRTRWPARLAVLAVSLAACGIGAEFALRAVKSLELDGALHLASPSMHIELHDRYGWLSPRSFLVERRDACYGDAVVAYNEAGFRAPPLSEAVDADVVVCVLGDSTMHGSQLSEGRTFSHRLASALRKRYERPYVLPLAVGGYGTLQEWMLYEDYCKPLQPDVVIHHWADNDPLNNSYLAERYSGTANNNGLPRPYWEDGRIVTRRPYPFALWDGFDQLLLVRRLNSTLLRLTRRAPDSTDSYLEEGWRVADTLLGKLAAEIDAPVALLAEGEHRARQIYERHGYRIITHPPIGGEMRCLPRDSHPTAAGHQVMLDAALPTVLEVLGAPPP